MSHPGQFVECVMNVSEGRDTQIINEIGSAMSAISGNYLLGVHTDRDHHRSVYTYVGSPSAVLSAALAATKLAIKLVDLRKHSGIHPRIGAVDVVPFVPLNCPMNVCIGLANEFGRTASKLFELPIYLYEQAAIFPGRRNLADIRRGQFEGLRIDITKMIEKKPDYGPSKLHASAGATAVGARNILIAFNIELDTRDIAKARSIASNVRESGGGLAFVKALGVPLETRGKVQVSMNLTNFRVTSLELVHKKVRVEAARLKVALGTSEIVGFVPREALTDETADKLKIRNYSPDLILEQRIKQLTGWSL